MAIDDVSVSQPDSGDFWKPAKKIALAFIALVIVVFIYKSFLRFTFYMLGHMDLLGPDFYGEHPLYVVLFDLISGGVLLTMAGLLLTGKARVTEWLDRMQLLATRQPARVFATGAVIGIAAAFISYLLVTLTDVFLYGGKFFLELHPDVLVVAALYILPGLAMYAGMVALVQGYFQRKTTERYGVLEGLIVAAMAYLVIIIVPDKWDQLAYPHISAQTLLMGATIAYLYLISKSPWLPVSFIVAYNFAYQAYYSVAMTFTYDPALFMGISEANAFFAARLAGTAIALALIWFLSRNRHLLHPDGLKIAVEKVLSRLTGV
jgi:hypothetical protein